MLKVIYFLLLASFVNAQPSLIVRKGVRFQLTGDTFLLDSLLLEDSSVLLLDSRHKSCLIRVNLFSAGTYVKIIGIGRDGEQGRDGTDGSIDALDVPGKDGTSGTTGTNLTLHFSNLAVQNLLEINLYGGHGGNGGRGGPIVKRAPTNLSQTPNQGLGGNGGHGGNGGNVVISCPIDMEKIVKSKIVINAQGGKGGNSGTPPELKVPSTFYAYERNGATGLKGKVKMLYLKR